MVTSGKLLYLSAAQDLRDANMKNKLSIWIIAHPWPAVEGGQGYEWELYNHDKPIAKSSPAHGDTYYYEKRSAIASAIRMRKLLFSWLNCFGGESELKRVCPITDVTNRGNKGQKVRIL